MKVQITEDVILNRIKLFSFLKGYTFTSGEYEILVYYVDEAHSMSWEDLCKKENLKNLSDRLGTTINSSRVRVHNLNKKIGDDKVWKMLYNLKNKVIDINIVV